MITDEELEIYKRQHGFKTDEEAYNFLKKRLFKICGGDNDIDTG